MNGEQEKNADRFMGFADIYDYARPECPKKAKELILKYLDRRPGVVVDMGCGTGLSTKIWANSDQVIGVEPNPDMRGIAEANLGDLGNISIISAFSDDTGLESESCDIITCSQSFHWMNPETTVREVSRLLKDGGVFAVYDCDWPPVCSWEAEIEYNKLADAVTAVEAEHPELKSRYTKWDKDRHLENIKAFGRFRYVREILFSNTEFCDARRFIAIALSQGGLQALTRSGYTEIDPYLDEFKRRIAGIFGDSSFTIEFCYRMRIGVK